MLKKLEIRNSILTGAVSFGLAMASLLNGAPAYAVANRSLNEATEFTHCLRQEPADGLLKTAVNNLYGLGYTRRAIEQVMARNPGSKACFEGLPLSKNIYQYHEFLIRIRVQTNDVLHNEFYFLYQDASTQAHHNFGEKEWVGLARSDVKRVFHDMLQSAGFSTVNVDPQLPPGPLALAQLAPAWITTENLRVEKTVSLFAIPKVTADDQQFYLVSWMNRGEGTNPFSTFDSPMGVVIRYFPGRDQAQLADTAWLSSQVLFPLEKARDRAQEGLKPLEFEAALVRMSGVDAD